MSFLLKKWNNYWFPETSSIFLAIGRIGIVAGQLAIIFIENNFLSKFAELSQLPHVFSPISAFRLISLPFGSGWFPPAWAFHAVYGATILFGLLSLIGLFTNVSFSSVNACWP